MESKTICPMCSKALKIKVLECESCHTNLSGTFEFPKMGIKDDEIFNFIKIFIYTEGNIKKAETILNCSYPKIKNLLKQAKKSLGLEDDQKNDSLTTNDRKRILTMLDDGQISFEEAMDKLKNLK